MAGKKQAYFTDTEELLDKYIRDAYKNGEVPPRQKWLVEKLVEERNRGKTEGEELYASDTAQSTASRALKKLVEKKKAILTAEKGYIPYTIKDERKALTSKIHAEIVFSRKEAFFVSLTTIAVPVEKKYLPHASDLFRQYLGIQNCYDILETNGYLLLMIKGKKEERKELLRSISHIVKTSSK